MNKDADKGNKLAIGAWPKANLLPPEVGIAAKGRAMRRNAIGLIMLTVIAVVAGYAGITVVSLGAQGQLDAANSHTQELYLKQAKYAEVRNVASLLQTATKARIAGTTTEIAWKQYLNDIQAILPAGTLVTNVVADAATPLTPFSQPSVPLQGDRIGELTFTATSASLPDVGAWLKSLAGLSGYVDASPGSVARQDDGTYKVTITMHINKDALLLRFDDAAKAARAKADAKKKTSDDAAGTANTNTDSTSSTINNTNGGE